MIKVDIGKDFSRILSGRTRKDGLFSAEEFVYDILLPKFKDYKCIELDFNNTEGYSSAFLEEMVSILAFELGMNYNLFTHKFKIVSDDIFLIEEIFEYVKNPTLKVLTTDMFKGYYIPIPIDNKIFSMELCEIIDIEVDIESISQYWHTGEVINLIYNQETCKYHFDESVDNWFWDDEYGYHSNKKYEYVQNYFTNDKFKNVMSTLYRELLEGKTIIGTANSYMFMQRFSYFSHYIFE